MWVKQCFPRLFAAAVLRYECAYVVNLVERDTSADVHVHGADVREYTVLTCTCSADVHSADVSAHRGISVIADSKMVWNQCDHK